MQLEEKVKSLEEQLSPTRIKETSHQEQLQFQTSDKNDLEVNHFFLYQIYTKFLILTIYSKATTPFKKMKLWRPPRLW